ncbi:MAG: F0F1 ATP synthase subunit delta [Methylovulum sp.]|jgi:F-type H+-transporting ATPase subunit delta
MSELATLARPYAQAVFKRAVETDSIEKWSEQLFFISEVMSDHEIKSLVINPKVNIDKTLGLVLDICQDYVDEEASNFIKLLFENKRLSLMPSILSLFESLKSEHGGYLHADVLTAYDLSAEALDNLSNSLALALGKKIHINVILDKSLIGGVLIRAGDIIIDGSIRGQLQQMQKTLQ